MKVKSFSGIEKGNRMWQCVCSCGKTITASTGLLNSGLVKSCGCVISWGENIIKDIFDANNILYKRQYTFKDCRGPKNGLLRFDFAVLDKDKKLKFLVEFQGKQHYVENKKKTNYGKMQREITDKTKKEYCTKKNIKLYEICYNDKIEDKVIQILKENN